MTCPIWRASRRGRMVSPRALSSSVPRRPQANAWARPAHKSATPPGSGPGPQRRRGACATTRQATPRGPAWSQHTARGPPCPSWPTRWRGPSLTCSSAPPPGRGRSASRVQGAEGVSRPPHGTWQGAAWLERARRLVCRRLCTCRGPEACYPRVRGCAWTATLAPAHAARVARRDVCCPAPEPGTHWRAAEVQPSLCVGTVRGHPSSARPQRIPALVRCTRHRGGDRASRRVWCSHPGWAPQQSNEVRARDRLQTAPGPAKRKKRKSPLRGVVCLLTKEASYGFGAGASRAMAFPSSPMALTLRLWGVQRPSRPSREH
jgi:hypothetical protein